MKKKHQNNPRKNNPLQSFVCDKCGVNPASLAVGGVSYCYSCKVEEDEILDNGEKMLFVYSDIMTSSIHPSSIDPIKVFQRKDISEADRKTVFDRCNNKCEIGLKGCTEIAKEIDHIIPVSRGGGNELYNLQGACSSCNRKKYNKI